MILGAITSILTALILMPIWMIALGRHIAGMASVLKYDDLGANLIDTDEEVSIDLPKVSGSSV